MSDEVMITLITVIGGGFITLLLALVNKINAVGKQVKQVGQDATIAREQTQNSHDTNLRDDLDEKHEHTHAVLTTVLEQIERLQTSDRDQWNAIDRINGRRRWPWT